MNVWMRGAAALLWVGCCAGTAAAQSAEDAKLVTAARVLETIRTAPDQNIPAWLMERAWGVAVVPEVIKVAMAVGGRRGKGVLSVRDASGRFGSPIFITLTGGSVGWQFGAQAADVVLVFTTQRSVENFKRGQLTLGASASIAAGPIGREGEAAAGTSAEVYAYSRTRGLFAGVALDGTVLLADKKANKRFYGRNVTPNEVTAGLVKNETEAARRLVAAIAANLPAGAQGAATPAARERAPAAVSTPAAGAAAGSSAGAQSFPLEDPAPGSEPR